MKLAYTPKEAAAALGMSVSKLYEHMQAGTIVAKKDGKKTLILASTLDGFLVSLPDARAAT